MSAVSEKQRKFMGAVMGCEKGGKCSPETKKASKSMNEKQIKDFLKKPAPKKGK